MQDEKFKVKFNDRVSIPKILFDMRDDNQSYVLLDILISMLQEQLLQGPKALRGFDLIIAIVNDRLPNIDISKIERFYTKNELQRLGIQFVEIDCNDYVKKNKFENLKLDLSNFQTFILPDNNDTKINSYHELLNLQILDNSTREDLANIIHDDLVFQTANDLKCKIMIKSDSMTQIAINILSDTIRGRGSEIPLKTQDIFIKDFEIIHPLRDVLNSEVKIYSNIRSLNDLSSNLKLSASKSDISTKNKTVGKMVTEYFTSLEVEYPETVSTVVKIGAKLSSSNSNNKSNGHCEICKIPIYNDPKLWLEQITVPGSVPPQSEEENANLQRYLDSLGDDNLQNNLDSENTKKAKLCYGCMVTLGVSNVSDFVWPCRPTKEEILSEYILETDDENDIDS